jgi:homoserine dehydrogenase
MSQQHALRIGLFGFGVVGEGLYKVLQQTPSLKASIEKVCIKNADKPRNAPAYLFTTEKNEILHNNNINVIVEVIDDADAAFQIVSAALRNGKAVVSASKKMLAEHLPEILALQQETGLPLLYEAAACASIPVIRNLEEYYDNDLLQSIQAIVNGSTNYILTKMFAEKLSFKEALLQAQQLGFAESNPTLDVEGFDAVNKWTLLLNHAYGIVEHPKNIVFNGIQQINSYDAAVASERGFQIKLVAQAAKLSNGTIAAFVLPQWVATTHPLSFVQHEYNGVVIESSLADQQFFYGKGAGSFPTASAVLSDIAALRYQYRYEYKKLLQQTPARLGSDFHLRVYVRFNEADVIPKADFVAIEEWHSGPQQQYIIGVIPFSKLQNSLWWKQPDVALIATTSPIVQDVALKNLQKKSLALAGVAVA